MAEHAVGHEEELFSLSVRPFQQVKQNGKTMCFKCFEEDGLMNFCREGAGLGQHFRADASKTLLSTVGNAKQFFRIATARK